MINFYNINSNHLEFNHLLGQSTFWQVFPFLGEEILLVKEALSVLNWFIYFGISAI
jgi:hypothetical protein